MIHFRRLLVALLVATACLATVAAPASAGGRSQDGNNDDPGQHGEGRHPSVVGTIHGAGRSNMTDLVAAGLKGDPCDRATVAAQHCAVSTFEIDVKLFSNHTAKGKLNCVDIVGDPTGYPGKIFGDITNWSQDVNTGAVTLIVPDGRFIAAPPFLGLGDPVGQFSVTIQTFGGAGVGHWTLDVPGFPSPYNGLSGCQELLTSGRIVGKGELFRLRDEE